MDDFVRGSVAESNCRFYKNIYPEPEELVRVKILDKEEHGFRCRLLEYNNIEGLVLINELKRGRIRSYNKILKKKKEYTVLVLRVHKQGSDDKALVFIDLSLKAVPSESLPAARDKWEKSKTVHGIMRTIAFRTKKKTVDLYEQFGWDLSKRFKHVYLGFKYIISQDSPETTMRNLNVPEVCIEFLLKELEKKMEATSEDVCAKLEMTCFSNEAIEGIQHAIQVGLKESTKEFPLVFRIIAAPLFEIYLNTMDPEAGKKKIMETMKKMEQALVEKGGKFKIVEKPISERIVDFLGSELVNVGDESK